MLEDWLHPKPARWPEFVIQPLLKDERERERGEEKKLVRNKWRDMGVGEEEWEEKVQRG